MSSNSTWRYTQKNIENNTKCKHYNWCKELLLYLREIT